MPTLTLADVDRESWLGEQRERVTELVRERDALRALVEAYAAERDDAIRETTGALQALALSRDETHGVRAQAEKAARERDEARAQVAALREALEKHWTAAIGKVKPTYLTELESVLADTEAAAQDFEQRASAAASLAEGGRWALALVAVNINAHVPADVAPLLAEHDAAVRASAYRSIALEIRASIACAKRDNDTLDEDWCEAAAETIEGYAEGDGAPDDDRCRRLIAECAALADHPTTEAGTVKAGETKP